MAARHAPEVSATATARQARWYRLRRSGLVTPFPRAEAAARALVGVQAQILSAAGLALWNRSPLRSHQDYLERLYRRRTLLKLWGQRHTLHLYEPADWPLLCAAQKARESGWVRYASKNGTLDAYESLLAEIGHRLQGAETLGRSDLVDSGLPLESWHLSAWGGLFSDLVRRGVACHAEPVRGEGRFAHRDRWLPEMAWGEMTADEANQTLLRRYLHCYGPATVRDFAYWRGSHLRSARRWRAALGDALVQVDLDGSPMLIPREDLETLLESPPPPEAWPVKLLYRFDPLLLAHKDKGWLIEPERHPLIWRPAGHIEGTILVHGRIEGSWRYDRRARGLTVTLRPFAPLSDGVREAAHAHAGGVAAFFDLPLDEIRTEQP